MKRLLLTIATALLLAAPVASQNVTLTFGYKSLACTQTLVNQGHCNLATNTLLIIDMPQLEVALIADALADFAGWTAQVTCTQEMVTAGDCLVGELGQLVANPIKKGDAAKLAHEEMLRRLVERHQIKQWEASLPPKPEVVKE